MSKDNVTPLRQPTQDQNIAQYVMQVLAAPSLTIPASEAERILASRDWLARIATGQMVVVAPTNPESEKGAPEKAGGTV